MKQLLLLLVSIFTMAAYSATDGPGVEIVLYEEEPTDEDIEPEGKRTLTLPVLCSIDKQSGVVLLNNQH